MYVPLAYSEEHLRRRNLRGQEAVRFYPSYSSYSMSKKRWVLSTGFWVYSRAYREVLQWVYMRNFIDSRATELFKYDRNLFFITNGYSRRRIIHLCISVRATQHQINMEKMCILCTLPSEQLATLARILSRAFRGEYMYRHGP